MFTPQFAIDLANLGSDGRSGALRPRPVGVRDLRTPSGLRVRVYYPGIYKKGARATSWFVDSIGDAALGYLHTMTPVQSGTLGFKVIGPLLRVAANALAPLSYAHVPGVFRDLEVDNGNDEIKLPAIVFSHGLTGTAEEHATLFAHWARQGFIVSSVQHTDGSSSRAVDADGKPIYYQHPPGMKGSDGMYPADFRPNQIKRREADLSAMYEYMVSKSEHFSSIIDSKRVVVGGFSYGAATAALSAATHRDRYAACILMDGWFNLDLKSIASCESDEQLPFPEKAHADGIDCPCFFIGSDEFAHYTHLKKRTDSLIAKCSHPQTESHVLDTTVHWSFMDLVVWLSSASNFVYRKAAGVADAQHSYKQLFEMTSSFLNKVIRP